MPVNYTLPPDTRVTGGGSPAADMDAVIDAVTALGAVYNVLNAAYAGGADPSGVADSTAAIQAALNAARTGDVVYLPRGQYLISSTLTIPGGGVLFRGDHPFRNMRAYDNSSALVCSASFTGTCAVTFANGTPCGAMQGIFIDGTNLPGGNTVNGITITNSASQGVLRDVAVQNFGGYGIAITSGTGNPDGWHLFNVGVTGTGNHALWWDYAVDGRGENLNLGTSATGTGDGFHTARLNNTWLIGCKSGGGGRGSGYVVTASSTGNSGGFINCHAYNNWKHGFDIDQQSGTGFLYLVGCSAYDNGQQGAGTGYANYYLYNNSNPADISLNGCMSRADSNLPDYGLYVASNTTSGITVTGSEMCGFISGWQDGGGNTGAIGMTNTVVSSGNASARTVTPISLHVPGHALGQVTPIEHGLAAWSFDPATSSSTQALTGGTVYLIAQYVSRFTPVTKLWWQSTTAIATPTAGQNWAGLVNSAGTLLASVGIDTQAGQTGVLSATIASTAVSPGLYWVALLFNGTGAPAVPTLRSTPNATAGATTLNQAAAASRMATNGTLQTSFAGFPITPTANNNFAPLLFAAIS